MRAVQVQAQRAARIGQGIGQGRFGGLQVGQQLRAALVEGLPVHRRPDLARGALEQARAQARLQLLDGMRRRRPGDAQRARCTGKAAQFDDAGEQLERVDA